MAKKHHETKYHKAQRMKVSRKLNKMSKELKKMCRHVKCM